MSDRVDVDRVRSAMNASADAGESLDMLTALKQSLYLFRKEHPDLIKCLIELSDQMDSHSRNINIAKCTGSATGIAGGVVAAIGIVGSFFTFGATLPLLIAGSAIAGAGGLTAGGSSVADVILSKGTWNKTQEKIKEYEERQKGLLAACVDIGQALGELGDGDVDFPNWKEFWVKLLFGAKTSATSLSWNMIANSVLNSLKLSRGLYIAGGAVGILRMPIDIYFLVDSSLNIARNRRHRVSIKIRELVEKLNDQCPTQEDIDKMYEVTVQDVLRKL